MRAALEKRAFAQDFFFELMRDSQRVRAVYLAGANGGSAASR